MIVGEARHHRVDPSNPFPQDGHWPTRAWCRCWTRPLATPPALCSKGTMRPLEDVLTFLTRAGFSESDAPHTYPVLSSFLHGRVRNELQAGQEPRGDR